MLDLKMRTENLLAFWAGQIAVASGCGVPQENNVPVLAGWLQQRLWAFDEAPWGAMAAEEIVAQARLVSEVVSAPGADEGEEVPPEWASCRVVASWLARRGYQVSVICGCGGGRKLGWCGQWSVMMGRWCVTPMPSVPAPTPPLVLVLQCYTLWCKLTLVTPGPKAQGVSSCPRQLPTMRGRPVLILGPGFGFPRPVGSFFSFFFTARHQTHAAADTTPICLNPSED
nr:MAG TPA: hypothetical protein [Caudoviricetes sp.]